MTSRLTLSFSPSYLRVEWAHHMSGHKRRFLVSMLTQWRSHNRPTHTIPAYTQNALQPLFRFLIQDLCCRFFNALQAWVAIFQRSPSISTCNWYWSTIPTIKPRFGYNYILYFLYYEAINKKISNEGLDTMLIPNKWHGTHATPLFLTIWPLRQTNNLFNLF